MSESHIASGVISLALNFSRNYRPTSNHCKQENSGHDLDSADNMSENGLRIHVAVADCGQGLDAEEKTIEKPFRIRRAGDAVVVETVKKREKKIQRDVDHRDEQSKLRPAQ